MSLGDKVRKERKVRGWSQAELADRAGVSAATINRIENGVVEHPKYKAVKGIAEAFGVTVTELDEGKAEKKIENVHNEYGIDVPLFSREAIDNMPIKVKKEILEALKKVGSKKT